MKEYIPPYWAMEDCYLYHADCLEVMTEIPDQSIDCIWTDPPYNISNDGMTCVGGKMVKVNKGEWDRSKGLLDDHTFNQAWLAACYRILKLNGTIWVCGNYQSYPSMAFAAQGAGFRILNEIIVQKSNPPPNLGCRCFTHSTETLMWATKATKGKKEEYYTFNYVTMKKENGGKQMKNVWQINAPPASERLWGKHPTQKPLTLIRRCLRASTTKGDIVFDPFTGSGTTGVAALELGLHFIGCDSDESYLEIATKRIEAEVGPQYFDKYGGD